MAQNEPGVTDETMLIVEIGDEQAGGTEGQLILEDVEFGKSRDNDPKHGVGNETPQGIQRGNITFEVSASAHLNGAAAELVRDLTPQKTLEAELRVSSSSDAASDFSILQTKLDWNDVSVEGTDDGDVVVSMDFDARGPGGDFSDEQADEIQDLGDLFGFGL